MIAHVLVRFKKGVPDAKSEKAKEELSSLSFIEDVCEGKYFQIEFEDMSLEEAQALIIEMCDKLLANLVYERYEITIE